MLLEGAGLVNVQAADSPLIFTEPGSLSFGDMNLLAGVRSSSSPCPSGTQAAGPDHGRSSSSRSPRARARRSSPSTVTVAPGGSVDVQVTARADAAAPRGQLRLRGAAPWRDDAPRPLRLLRHRPGLHGVAARQLRRVQEGSTRTGQSFADLYRFPAAPFGHSPDYGIGPDMREDGGERLYSIRVRNRVVNIGAAVISSSPGAAIDPFFLGAKDENAVQGYVGTPTNINGLTIGYRPVGAAGAVFAAQGRIASPWIPAATSSRMRAWPAPTGSGRG